MEEYTVDYNQPFDLVLAENPTTGYSWDLQTSSGLRLLNETFRPDISARSGIVGSGGHTIYTFLPVSRDTQEIYATYRQPWNPRSATYRDIIIYVQ